METIEITARYISENARMNFMPAAFHNAFFSADHFIQSFLNRYAKDYQGDIGSIYRPAMAHFLSKRPTLFGSRCLTILKMNAARAKWGLLFACTPTATFADWHMKKAKPS